MAKTNKHFKQNKAKPGRQVPLKRRKYTLEFKEKVRAWKLIDNMKNKDISKRVEAELGYLVTMPTLCTWWAPKTVANIQQLAPDRTNVNDTRYNHTQRPDVFVDMEQILARKVRAILLTGVPYSRTVVQILAIHIFHKLIAYNLYDVHGQRKQRSEKLDEEIINAVEHSRLVSRYMCRSSRKTECHNSMLASKNQQRATHVCKLCRRKFKIEVNLTLHVYWHTIKENDADPDDPMENSENEDEERDPQFKFVASSVWVLNFLVRHDSQRLKMKGEKGSADHAAVAPWVHEWLTFLHTDYVIKHQKTFQQVINIIVNFDECGSQFKSLPQYSYLGRTQEIRAKKPVLARITGLFGTTMSGRKFKPLIIGKAKKPRAFSKLSNVEEDLQVHYNHSKNAWMTSEIFRSWFLNCFLCEVGPILDKDMQIQFLIDNCSAHTPKHIDEQLWMLDPNVCIKMLPPNTTSLIQLMDQAVLACVKSYQKRDIKH